MPELESLDIEILANPASRWIAAGLVAVALIVALGAARALIAGRLRASAERNPTGWRALVRTIATRITTLFIVVLSVFVGALLLDLPDGWRTVVISIVSITVFFQAALIADQAIDFFSTREVTRHGQRNSSIQNAIALIQFISRTAVWSIAILLVLDNLGFNVTALVAGLGIGGIAIALAAQNVLGDLFASLAIILDKPFVVGDFITFDNYAGTVERIGIKTTRLRSLSGEQLVCANADLLSTRVRNHRRMSERWVVFTINVIYETEPDVLESIPTLLKEIVLSEKHVRFERAHLHSFADLAVKFEIAYFVLSPKYLEYMDIQQSINFKIFQAFAEKGIQFGRTVRVPSPILSKETA